MKCIVTGRPYTVFGYGGKQVRDNIHSRDLIRAFDAFHRNPRSGAVYNIGGGRESNCSMIEAIGLCEQVAGREAQWTYADENRAGDHKWWISGLQRFKADYPEWRLEYDVAEILQEIYDAQRRTLDGGSRRMIDRGKHNLLGVGVDAVDYAGRGEPHRRRAREQRPLRRLAARGARRDDRRPRREASLPAQRLRPDLPRRPAGPLGAQSAPSGAELSEPRLRPAADARSLPRRGRARAADLPLRRRRRTARARCRRT